MIFFSTLFLGIIVTIIFIPLLKAIAVRCEVVDLPNARKVHHSPKPKIGGVAMAIGIIFPTLFWIPEDRFLSALLVGAGVLVVFGFIDDIRDLDCQGKLVGQVIAALMVVGYGDLSIRNLGDCLPEVMVPDWIALPLTLLAIVGVTNAINLSDGLDGLAGGISMMIFICLGFVAFQNGMMAISLLVVSVIGAIFGFLRFNTHPAVIFMGDAGSQLLGFLAVSLSIYISQNSEPISSMFPLLLLGFPILDTITVMIRRILNGVSPFKADQNHFHHKLIRLGLRHAEAVVVLYSLQCVLVLSAFLLRFHSEWILLAIYLSFCGSVLLGFHWADRLSWTLPQWGLLDRLITKRTAVMNKRYQLIRVCFGMLEVGAPLLLLVCCLALTDVPFYMGIVALVLVVALCVGWLICRTWMVGMLWLVLFLMIPYLVFLAHLHLQELVSPQAQLVYHVAFMFIAFLAVTTLKLTRRRKGFKTNPFDFLIIFASLFITSISEIKYAIEDISLITAKIIALFFAFEVLLGESRGKVRKLNLFMVIALGTVGVKALI